MRTGSVWLRGHRAGTLTETPQGYRFVYDREYLADARRPAISLTLPLRSEPYESPRLFPFFQSLLAEGATMRAQCRKLRLDEADTFGRLLKTTADDVIGAVTVREETAR